MSLRYSFRHLFYGGKIQKERLYKVLQDLDSKSGSSDSASGQIVGQLQTEMATVKGQIGSESTEGSILARLKALEDKE